MPYISEKAKLAGTKHDKRAKLTQAQKAEIKLLYGKVSQRKLATKYNVSRRLIQFVGNPEMHKANLERRKERGGSKQYYDTNYNTEAQKRHRRRKQQLFIQGKIKLPEKNN